MRKRRGAWAGRYLGDARVRKALAVGAVAVVALLATEAALRVESLWSRFPRGEALMALRTRHHWSPATQADPFKPPFPVFANADIIDPTRLDLIEKAARLPPNAVWRGENFLLSDPGRPRGEFSVRTNAFGFRGPPRTKAKPRGVKRIICLGDYMTYGHGVEEEDTYVSRLESRLNREGPGRYEVWNGGKPSGTAIMAYARLRKEIWEYQPDLLILQYGIVDMYIWEGDQDMRVAYGHRYIPGPVHELLRYLSAHSFLLRRVNRALLDGRWTQNINRWHMLTEKMIEAAHARGVPVLLIDRSRNDLLFPNYRKLVKGREQARWISAYRSFRRFPPTEKQWGESLRRDDNWALEYFGESARERPMPFIPYHVDPLQLSGAGHEAVTRALYKPVMELLHPSRRQKAG